MVRHFQEVGSIAALPDLPKAVKVTLLKLVMRSGTLQYEKQAVNLMGRDEPGKRDGFDTLIDHAPEKLHFVKQAQHLIYYPDTKHLENNNITILILIDVFLSFFVTVPGQVCQCSPILTGLACYLLGK